MSARPSPFDVASVKVYVKASDASGIYRVELIVNGKVVARDSTVSYVLGVNTKKVARIWYRK